MPMEFIRQQKQDWTSDFSLATRTLRGYLENFSIHSENMFPLVCLLCLTILVALL